MEKPQLQEITNINLPEIEEFRLDNNIPVYAFNAGFQQVLKLELVFQAGKWHEDLKGQAVFTSSMLKESTKSFSSDEIANRMDFLGAQIKSACGNDLVIVEIYCLNRHLEKILQIVHSILTECAFLESEFEYRRDIYLQKLHVNRKRIEYLSQKEMNRSLFGDHHPYGYIISNHDIEQLNVHNLKGFYGKRITSDNCKIFIAGHFLKDTKELLNRYLGKGLRHGHGVEKKFEPESNSNRRVYLEQKNSSQAALRIGKRMVKRNHPDYFTIRILNILLGGYFGSRLMSNIREDKGYTYGIYSVLTPYLRDAMLYITSEVGRDVCTPALEEIYHELHRLMEEPVEHEELMLVRNYIKGRILNTIDGPFQSAHMVKNIAIHGLNFSFFDEYLHKVNSITPEELMATANQYFSPDSFHEIVAGCLITR